MHKYQEKKTFDEAVTLCKSHGQMLVAIKCVAEIEIVFRTILNPAAYTWNREFKTADRWILIQIGTLTDEMQSL